LGIAGTRNSGKDTLFEHLKRLDYRFQHYAFASALKADLRPLIQSQFKIDPMTAVGKDKELIRPILVAYGCTWRELDIDHWAKRVADDIKQNQFYNPQNLIAAICDFRFESEVALFRERFGPAFRLVNLTRADAPAPTDEEKKHFEKVAAMADYHILWGKDTEEQRALVAAKLIQWLENSLELSRKSQI
jgi:hypothetical protein